MNLHIVPISIRNANEFISKWHRHNTPVRVGGRFAIACASEDGEIHGAAIGGVPRSRFLMERNMLEVLRVATDGTKNACSILYGRSARIAQDMGYDAAFTYTLKSESGASMRAVGWVLDADNAGGHAWVTRGRKNLPISTETKNRWVRWFVKKEVTE